MRPSRRQPDEMRPVRITRGYTRHAEGSVLVEFGDTRVLCTASVLERQAPHLKGTSKGWVTAEYGMLPRSTNTRTDREAARGKQSGRTQEIQRLIGRALRAVIDLGRLGARTIPLDCDVIQADGGTRTAGITGAFVALHDAIDGLIARKALVASPLRDFVAAVSVGLASGRSRSIATCCKPTAARARPRSRVDSLPCTTRSRHSLRALCLHRCRWSISSPPSRSACMPACPCSIWTMPRIRPATPT